MSTKKTSKEKVEREDKIEEDLKKNKNKDNENEKLDQIKDEKEEDPIHKERSKIRREIHWEEFIAESDDKKRKRNAPIRLWISDTIEPKLMDTIVKELYLAADRPEKEVHVYVNTYGGCVYTGMAIYDAMQKIPNKVTTIGTGKIMSCGNLIMAGGNRRIMTPGSSYMFHDISSGTWGSPSEMRADLDHTEALGKRFCAILAKTCKLTTDKLMELSAAKKNWYWTPEECLEMGLIDEIGYL